MTLPLKNLYLGREIKFYDEFMSLRDALIRDFFEFHPDYKDLSDHYVDAKTGQYSEGGWRLSPVKVNECNWPTKPDIPDPSKETPESVVKDITEKTNNFLRAKINEGSIGKDLISTKLPTAAELVKRFGKHCPMAAYTVLNPNSVIKRHTGIENRDAKHIRIHIPLIVPEGDIGLEVEGEIADWSDLFAFDNQKLHSAWNFTDKTRLVFIIDLTREICELPPGIPWSFKHRREVPDFPKTSNFDLTK